EGTVLPAICTPHETRSRQARHHAGSACGHGAARGCESMSTVAHVEHLSKKYRKTVALDDVNFTLEKDKIYGLLGRNGAGKTTIMSILAAQGFETSGSVAVFDEHPFENDRVLQRICFIRESQKYPDDFRPKHAFKAASLFYSGWDQEF